MKRESNDKRKHDVAGNNDDLPADSFNLFWVDGAHTLKKERKEG